MKTDKSNTYQQYDFSPLFESGNLFWNSLSRMAQSPFCDEKTDDETNRQPFPSWNETCDGIMEMFSVSNGNDAFQTISELSDSFMKTTLDYSQENMGHCFKMLENFENYCCTKAPDKISFYALTAKQQHDILQKALSIPQIGLTREYQEKINRTIDKMTAFNISAVEFMQLLSLPIEKAFILIQKDAAEMTTSAEMSGDPKKLYNKWLEKVESGYNDLYYSPDYTRHLGHTLNTMSEMKSAYEDILHDGIKIAGLADQKDLDELARDIYLIRKAVKAVEKKINFFENTLEKDKEHE